VRAGIAAEQGREAQFTEGRRDSSLFIGSGAGKKSKRKLSPKRRDRNLEISSTRKEGKPIFVAEIVLRSRQKEKRVAAKRRNQNLVGNPAFRGKKRRSHPAIESGKNSFRSPREGGPMLQPSVAPLGEGSGVQRL